MFIASVTASPTVSGYPQNGLIEQDARELEVRLCPTQIWSEKRAVLYSGHV